MKSVIVGTAGHVDHGKTALVLALTGVNTDRWEEERRRGITIDLGFAPLPLPGIDADVSIVDVPGHEDFVKNMLAGASGVDLLLLVVAADEGPMPQTIEHLWIARYLGVERGVVAVTKTDLVEDAWIELVSESIREELRRVIGRDDWAVVPASATNGTGVEAVRSAIADTVRERRTRSDADLFRMPVDRSFTVRGVGTVVTGTVWSGRVFQGNEIRIMPVGRSARVRGIQVHGGEVDAAVAGQRAALALTGVQRDEVARGDVLCSSEVWRPVRVIDAALQVSPDSPRPLSHWQRVRLHLGTSEAMARVVTYEADEIEPGAAGLAQLRLERSLIARHGDRFVLRFYSPVTTIGGGIVIDPWAAARGRGRGEAARRLSRLATAIDADLIEAWVAERREGVTTEQLAILTGAPPAALIPVLGDLQARARVSQPGERWHSGEELRHARSELIETLRAGHSREASAPGVQLEELRSRMGRAAEIVNLALQELQGEGRIRVEGSVAALAEHVPSLKPSQERMARAARAALRQGALSPPGLRELAARLEVEAQELIPVLRFLTRAGELVEVTPDLFFEREAVEEAKRLVVERLRRGGATAGELREELGMSRRCAIPLFEHLDAGGLTRRTPEGRVLREGA